MRMTPPLFLAIAAFILASPTLSLSQQRELTGRKAGQVRVFGDAPQLKLVWCPAGKFVMGDDRGRHFDVELTQGFWIGQTEITQAQWTAVMETKPWTPADNPDPTQIWGVKDGPEYPASYISWLDAKSFCLKLTERMHVAGELPEEWSVQLPTEAQWEYACRAGTTHDYYPGRATNNHLDLRDFAWFSWNAHDGLDDADQHPREVALKQPNAWNLYDMSGNVEEWVADGSPQRPGRHFVGGRDPYVAPTGKPRVLRGGCYMTPENNCRVYSGHSQKSFFDKNALAGFRVTLVKTPPEL